MACIMACQLEAWSSVGPGQGVGSCKGMLEYSPGAYLPSQPLSVGARHNTRDETILHTSYEYSYVGLYEVSMSSIDGEYYWVSRKYWGREWFMGARV